MRAFVIIGMALADLAVVLTFLFDGICGSPDFASCQELSRFCHSDLDSVGFFVNLQKFVWEPSQVGAWLGFHLDFSLNIISVPHSKITRLQGSISRVIALDDPFNARSDFSPKVLVFNFYTATFGRGGISFFGSPV